MNYDVSFFSSDVGILGSEDKCSIKEALADGGVKFFYIKADEV